MLPVQFNSTVLRNSTPFHIPEMNSKSSKPHYLRGNVLHDIRKWKRRVMIICSSEPTPGPIYGIFVQLKLRKLVEFSASCKGIPTFPPSPSPQIPRSLSEWCLVVDNRGFLLHFVIGWLALILSHAVLWFVWTYSMADFLRSLVGLPPRASCPSCTCSYTVQTMKLRITQNTRMFGHFAATAWKRPLN